MAQAIVDMAKQGERESTRNTWILRIAVAALVVAVAGVLIAAL